jgi:uncharacterized peroxidase-related enzyme
LQDEAKAVAIEADYATAQLSDRERAILDYAVKLTRTPGAMAESDVDTLRAAGLEDDEILDVCQVAAYYNYANRLADGLGIELEAYWGEEAGEA